MEQEFKTFCINNQLVSESKTILVALSGGVDSVVLCNLLNSLNWPFAIAHCNFQLRSNQSDEDELFCKKLADKYQVTFFSIRFDTNKIAQERKESIQLAARNLRYQWLEEIRSENQFASIATAHHINDRIETSIYNFTKGTGIRGLRSIPIRNGVIIRPLLFAAKEDILAYAKNNHLDHREDNSNQATKYNRNKIRLEVIPVLKSINPNLEKTAVQSFLHLEDIEKIYQWSIQYWHKLIVSESENQIVIDLNKLFEAPASPTLLYEIIHSFGFQKEQVESILSKNTKASGAQFHSKSHRLLLNRHQLLISPLNTVETKTGFISLLQNELQHNELRLQMEWDLSIPKEFGSDKNIAYFDQSKLQFPLQLRKWQTGDSFCPIGMHGKTQKLKDFFINQKLSIYDKEQVWLLCSGDYICWIVGHRIDERFKVESTSKQILKITLAN